MTDTLNWLRPKEDAGRWVTVPTFIMRQVVDEIEALRKDNDRLDELMSAIAMAWVQMPPLPPGKLPSALDLAIMKAADFTTGLHRIKEGKESD